jgi:hypothetical protein
MSTHPEVAGAADRPVRRPEDARLPSDGDTRSMPSHPVGAE